MVATMKCAGLREAGPLLGMIFLLIFFGIGHCSVIVLAGTFTEAAQHYLNWSEQSRGTSILKKTCGALVMLGGVYMIYTAL